LSCTRHAAFERIHPFIDGNGRVGRLLTNLLLVRLGYPPAIIQKRQRERYLKALAQADRSDAGPLGELIARAVIDNLTSDGLYVCKCRIARGTKNIAEERDGFLGSQFGMLKRLGAIVEIEVVLMTGCSTGIGRASATTLGGAAYEVGATARSQDA
jgi:Uncharacterized conserved protein